MKSESKILLELSEQELNFLIWAMSFMEGGPFGDDEEQQREETEFKVKRALADLEDERYSHLTASSVNDSIWYLLHPEIVRVSRTRFESGHFADSVEAAFKEINKVVKEIVKSNSGEEIDGAPLMYKAFSQNDPIIRIGDLSTETGRNIQQGYMQIFAGAIIGIRNPKAHQNEVIDFTEAFHLIIIASQLMRKLDERV